MEARPTWLTDLDNLFCTVLISMAICCQTESMSQSDAYSKQRLRSHTIPPFRYIQSFLMIQATFNFKFRNYNNPQSAVQPLATTAASYLKLHVPFSNLSSSRHSRMNPFSPHSSPQLFFTNQYLQHASGCSLFTCWPKPTTATAWLTPRGSLEQPHSLLVSLRIPPAQFFMQSLMKKGTATAP